MMTSQADVMETGVAIGQAAENVCVCVCASAPSEAMQWSHQSGRVLDGCSLFVFPAEEEKLQEEISGWEKEQKGRKEEATGDGAGEQPR